MGLAASQARLLTITARLADNELRSQTINNAKMRLATQSAQASDKYVTALNNAQMMFTNTDEYGLSQTVPLTFNSLTQYSQYNNQYGIVNSAGQILVSEEDAKIFQTHTHDLEGFLKAHDLEWETTYFDETSGDLPEKLASFYGTGYSPENVEDGLCLSTAFIGDLFAGKTNEQLKEMYLNSISEDASIEVLSYDNIAKNYATEIQNISKNIPREIYNTVFGENKPLDMIKGDLPEIKTDNTSQIINELRNLLLGITENNEEPKKYSLEYLYGTNNYITKDTYNRLNDSISTLKMGGNNNTYTDRIFIEAGLSNIPEAVKETKKYKDSLGSEFKATVTTYTIQFSNDLKFVIVLGEPKPVINPENGETSYSRTYTRNYIYCASSELTKDDPTASCQLYRNGVTYNNMTENEAQNANLGAGNLSGITANNIEANLQSIIEGLKYTTYETDDNGKVKKDNNKPVERGIYELKKNEKSISLGQLVKPESPDDLNNIIDEIITQYVNSIFNVPESFDYEKIISNNSQITLNNLKNAQKAFEKYITIKNEENEITKEIKINIPKDIDCLTDFGKFIAEKYPNDIFAENKYLKSVFESYLTEKMIDVLGEPKYGWVDNSANPTTNPDAKAQWLTNLFNRMQSGYKVLENGLASSKEWLEHAFESGLVTMEQVDKSFNWISMDYKSCSNITEQTDNSALVAKAEAEYNRAMNDIKQKDSLYDLQLKNIDTEHTSLQTEYDVIKGVINKNIERTMKFDQSA